jgi:hypothetical protein
MTNAQMEVLERATPEIEKINRELLDFVEESRHDEFNALLRDFLAVFQKMAIDIAKIG